MILRSVKSFDENFLLTKILEILDKDISDDAQKELHKTCKAFYSNLKIKWRQTNYTKKNFCNKYSNWLKNTFIYPSIFLREISTVESPFKKKKTSHNSDLSGSTEKMENSKNIGKFESYSERHKRRVTLPLQKNKSSYVLLHAAKLKLKAEGKNDMYSILNYLIKNPSEAKRIRDACYTKQPKRAKLFSSEKALGLMISAKWSRFEYNTLKKLALKKILKYLPITR